MANTKVPIELSSTPGIIDNSTATAITIDSAGAATFSGNVGIGTSSPSFLGFGSSTGGIDIVNSTNAALRLSGNAADAMFFVSGSGQHWLYGKGAVPMTFSTNGTERMRLDASGNLGIGRTSNIDYLLDVQKPADAYIRISSATTQENAGIILANQNGTKWIIEKDGPSHDLFIKSAAVTAMTISQAGNLGLGTTTPAYQLTLSSNPSFWEAGLQTEVVGGNQVLKIVSDAFGGGGRTGNIEFHVNSVGATPAVKINASGNLLVGSSSPPANRRLYVESVNYPAQMYATTAGINYPTLQLKNAHATGGNTCTQIDFRNAADASVGQVKSTASATIFATSSDYRLKEDDVAMTGATERVKALRPINFAWKLDGSRVDGFFAHELAEVVPEAATGTKDAMCDEEYEVTPAVEEVKDEEGNVTTEAVAAVMGTRSVPDYQGIDQSKLVPLLTATIQELIARIEALEGA